MRKRPEIPEDVFFDVGPSEEEEPEEVGEEAQQQPRAETDAADRRPADLRRADSPKQPAEAEHADSDSSRIGRPPAQEGPKVAVTLYLTEPVAHLLEEVKFRLLTEYDVKTSKSAIADFAVRHGLDDLQAVADDLRRD